MGYLPDIKNATFSAESRLNHQNISQKMKAGYLYLVVKKETDHEFEVGELNEH